MPISPKGVVEVVATLLYHRLVIQYNKQRRRRHAQLAEVTIPFNALITLFSSQDNEAEYFALDLHTDRSRSVFWAALGHHTTEAGQR